MLSILHQPLVISTANSKTESRNSYSIQQNLLITLKLLFNVLLYIVFPHLVFRLYGSSFIIFVLSKVVLSAQVCCPSREVLNGDLVASLILWNLYYCYRMPKRVSRIGLNTTTMPNQVHLSCHPEKYLSLKESLMITVTISTKRSWNDGRWPCSSKPRWDVLLYEYIQS